MSTRREQAEHLGMGIITAAIGMAAATIGLFLWPDPPVAGVPVTWSAEGGTATATITDLTPLKGEYPIHLQMASGAELRGIGMSREVLHQHVKVTVSFDDDATFTRLPITRPTAYADEADYPYLSVASVHNPRSTRAVVRVDVDGQVKWPDGMLLVVQNDWLSSSARQDKRVTTTHLLILGGLVAGALVVALPAWLLLLHRQRLRRVPMSKINCPEDSKRLRKEPENPRR